MSQSLRTHARTVRIAVVIPALDEEAALPLVLAEIPRDRVDVVVVVDNGSRDRTAIVARDAGAFVVSEPRRGYGSACLAGLAVLLERGAGEHPPLADGDIVVFLDADHSDHAAELPLLVDPILSGRAHFVVGARSADPASRAALTPQQRFGNELACRLMRILFGTRFSDLGPFRAIRVDALRHLAMRDRDYGWTVEMQLKSRVAGLTALEVPVHYRDRIGTSKISGTVWGSLRAGWKILGWILGWRITLAWPGKRLPKFHARAPNAAR
ncbi:MAG: glycosyltransferase family 2 protein [Planctomycetes bacterium]|nr:glycosyltransferase family 2 protein [Planctomycetota bacterium]